MALMSASLRAQPGVPGSSAIRVATGGALRLMDAAVFLSVWTLCVLTNWDTATKILLNVAAVGLLCLKEVAVHRYLLRHPESLTR
ncbi:MAG: hypothetical protein ABS910_00325 [Arthrobacter sp.]